MYSWNKKHIKELINYLYSIDSNLLEIEDDINILETLLLNKKESKKEQMEYNLYYENDEYSKLKLNNDIIRKISDKYFSLNLKGFKYKKIKSSKSDIIEFTFDNIRNINKQWAKALEPYIFTKDNLSFKRNNNCEVIYLEYLKNFYISLPKNNNITDYLNPTHEFLHIYSYLLNPKFINAVETEFLSLLGEMITSYELRKQKFHLREVIKSDLESLEITLSYLKAIEYKRLALKENIHPQNKFYFYENIVELKNKQIKDMYLTSLDYNYSIVISYFLALELFKIYKIDKEKCIYLCEKIINSNDDLHNKLRDNNITLLDNDKKYIKKLKKEYLILKK